MPSWSSLPKDLIDPLCSYSCLLISSALQQIPFTFLYIYHFITLLNPFSSQLFFLFSPIESTSQAKLLLPYRISFDLLTSSYIFNDHNLLTNNNALTFNFPLLNILLLHRHPSISSLILFLSQLTLPYFSYFSF